MPPSRCECHVFHGPFNPVDPNAAEQLPLKLAVATTQHAQRKSALEGFALPHSISVRIAPHHERDAPKSLKKICTLSSCGTAVIALMAYYYRKEGRAAVVEEISDVAVVRCPTKRCKRGTARHHSDTAGAARTQ